jgi:YebC/PmpR family DNA-binding regulatory protein
MSGHSKWATIKHKKGATDAKRGKIFNKLIREVTIAAKIGGADLSSNPRLRKAIQDAKDQSMPNDTIHRAVKRGAGELGGDAYEEVLYEGTGPAGTLFLVEGTTDNRNRTVAEIRKIFERNGGLLGGASTAGWAFERKGLIQFEQANASEDQLMEVAVAAGADDYVADGDDWQVSTPPEKLNVILEALEVQKIAVRASSLSYLPKVKKSVSGTSAEQAMNLVEMLDDHDDVQNVYADFELSDEALMTLQNS